MFIHEIAISRIRKSFRSDISSAIIFYGKELNLVSKCTKMDNLYWGIIKIRG